MVESPYRKKGGRMAFEDAKKVLSRAGARAMIGKIIRIESLQLKLEGRVVDAKTENGFVSLQMDSGQTLNISHPGYAHSFSQAKPNDRSFTFEFRYSVIGHGGIHHFNEKAEVMI